MRKTSKTAARGARAHAPRGRQPSYLLDEASRVNCWALGRAARARLTAHVRAGLPAEDVSVNPFDWQPACRLWDRGFNGKPYRKEKQAPPVSMPSVELWGSEWAS